MTEPRPEIPAAEMLREETRRMLDAQYGAVMSLRANAITMLTVGSLVAALFGSQLPTNRSGAADAFVIVALIAFTASVVLVGYIVKPRKFRFDHSIESQLTLLRDHQEVRPDLLAVTWAEGYDTDRAENENVIDRLMDWFAVVCWLVGAQAGGWVLAVLFV